jgi:hypothetical protein
MGQDTGNPTPPSARPAALLVIRISPADIGQRVTVRHRIFDEPEHLTDLLGYLRRWSDGVLVVEHESGEHREVREADVVAAKVIPPKSARTIHGDRRANP